MTYAWCVPRGSAKSFKVLGSSRPLDVRTELVLWFHVSEGFGMHGAYDDTLSKLLARYTWPTLASDVHDFISTCIDCRKLRGKPFVSAQVRSDMYDGPFVVIFFDHVGPFRPTSPQGNKFILTAVCGFSGWG